MFDLNDYFLKNQFNGYIVHNGITYYFNGKKNRINSYDFWGGFDSPEKITKIVLG